MKKSADHVELQQTEGKIHYFALVYTIVSLVSVKGVSFSETFHFKTCFNIIITLERSIEYESLPC